MSNEQLFKSLAEKDLNKLNKLVTDGWYETSDFEEAVLSLSNSLAMLHQEIYEDRKEGEHLQKTKLAKGA